MDSEDIWNMNYINNKTRQTVVAIQWIGTNYEEIKESLRGYWNILDYDIKQHLIGIDRHFIVYKSDYIILTGRQLSVRTERRFNREYRRLTMPTITRNSATKFECVEFYKYYEVISGSTFFETGTILSVQPDGLVIIVRNCGLQMIPIQTGMHCVEVKELRPNDILTIKIENLA